MGNAEKSGMFRAGCSASMVNTVGAFASQWVNAEMSFQTPTAEIHGSALFVGLRDVRSFRRQTVQ